MPIRKKGSYLEIEFGWPKATTAGTIKVVSLFMLILGFISLLASAVLDSYVTAFIGLGLVFWGALLLLITPTKYVKLELLNAASSSSLYNIERILATTEPNQKGIYLPPKNLQDYTSSLIFIPPVPNQPLPTSAQTDTQELQSKNPVGLLITPPGLGLSKLFAKQLKRPFTESSLQELQTQLPKLFEDLQITKHLALETKDNSITVQIRNHIFRDLSEETKRLPRTHRTVGSPLSSALACVFAKVTGKPITIEKEETSPEGTTTIQYIILEN